ncbi:hypothetical protein GBAR_LOCUS9290, partial [Geodia barretti]
MAGRRPAELSEQSDDDVQKTSSSSSADTHGLSSKDVSDSSETPPPL